MQNKICSFTIDEFIERVASFHGYPAPGVILGGFMIDLAYQHLPEEGLYDAIAETEKCVPDAIQLLTPCTTGNGWLRLFNTGRLALALYNKKTGDGVRVYVDPAKLEQWSEIKTWLFKLKPKKEQDSKLLLEQVKGAGTSILSWQSIKVELSQVEKKHRDTFVICPSCKESYPARDGETCLGCQGKVPYTK